MNVSIQQHDKLSSKPPIVAVIDFDDVNCRVEIRSTRPLSPVDVQVLFQNWQRTRDKR
jgi:hypothetical protein